MDIDRDITQSEYEFVLLLRKLKPYGKLEVARNQNGFEYTATLTNPERKVIEIK